jgi:hypothetical protein
MKPSADEPVARSLAAERMRRSRRRRKNKLLWLAIELRESEVNALSRKGYLHEDARNDPCSIQKALYRFFERVLAPYDSDAKQRSM